jgi:hypothetical protein
MPIDFPDSPDVDDLFTVGDRTWRWTGVAWDTVEEVITGPTGPTGPEGNFTVTGPTAPTGATGPIEGDVWFNSESGRTFVYYDSFWVESSSAVVGAQGATGPAGPATFVQSSTTGPTTGDGSDGDLWIVYS